MLGRFGRCTLRWIYRLPASFLKDERGCIGRGFKVEHAIQRARDRVKRPLNSLAVEPVVFNEAEDGALIGNTVIDEVRLRERRNHQQGKPWPVATAALGMRRARRDAG